jgi:hypothetical protein
MTGLVAGFGPGHIPTAPALLYLVPFYVNCQDLTCLSLLWYAG